MAAGSGGKRRARADDGTWSSRERDHEMEDTALVQQITASGVMREMDREQMAAYLERARARLTWHDAAWHGAGDVHTYACAALLEERIGHARVADAGPVSVLTTAYGIGLISRYELVIAVETMLGAHDARTRFSETH